jgi:hypothetical protein
MEADSVCTGPERRDWSHRRWRKLHLGMNADTHEIVAMELTPDDVGDVSEVAHLLDADVASMTADGAYDGDTGYDAVTERHPDATVIIPPRVTAVASGARAPQRDLHIATIAKHGRMVGNVVQVTIDEV